VYQTHVVNKSPNSGGSYSEGDEVIGVRYPRHLADQGLGSVRLIEAFDENVDKHKLGVQALLRACAV
jgi:hypothetical protein